MADYQECTACGAEVDPYPNVEELSAAGVEPPPIVDFVCPACGETVTALPVLGKTIWLGPDEYMTDTEEMG